VTKLATLLVKTLAKPLSKQIKHWSAEKNFSKRVLIGIGQSSHSITSRMTIWSAGYKVKHITPLEEEKALSTGAEFVSEAFVLFVSAGAVIFEYNRTNEKTRQKEEGLRRKADQERSSLQAKLRALDVRVKALEEVVEKNNNTILSLGRQKYVAPQASQLVPITDDDSNTEPSSPGATVPDMTDIASAPDSALPPMTDGTTEAKEVAWWWWRPW
jgi:optic atrophy 3 protein